MADFKIVYEEMDKVLNNPKQEATSFFRLSSILQDFDTLLREQIQIDTGDRIKQVIQRLKNGENLSTDEKGLVEIWIVGDAESYADMENNFDDWNQEFKRLIGEIKRYQATSLDVETSLKIRGLLRDAISVLADITYYLEQKDRVGNFRKSINQLSADDTAVLIQLLETKQKSWEF